MCFMVYFIKSSAVRQLKSLFFIQYKIFNEYCNKLHFNVKSA